MPEKEDVQGTCTIINLAGVGERASIAGDLEPLLKKGTYTCPGDCNKLGVVVISARATEGLVIAVPGGTSKAG